MNLKRNDHNYAMALRNEASEPLQKPATESCACEPKTSESEEKKNNSFAMTDNV